MNAKTFPQVFMAWLIASIPYLAWYDLRAYKALLNTYPMTGWKRLLLSCPLNRSICGPSVGSSLASFSQ